MALTVNKIPRYKGLSGSDPQIQDSNLTDDGSTVTSELPLTLKLVTAPGTPTSGYTHAYIDTADGHLKIKDSTGTVTDITSAGSGGTWGTISGTLSNQTDLQAALDAKQAAFTSSAGLRSALSDETGTGAAVFANGPTLIAPVLGTPASGTLTNCTGLPIAGGGTGQATAQAAIDALTDAVGKTPGYVLTTDGTNATWAAQTGGAWTDSGTTLYNTTTTDDVVIGANSPIDSAKFTVNGDADQIQCVIQGHSTQTSNILNVEKSDGTKLLQVTESGVTIGGTGSGIQLAENTSLALDPAGSADGKWSGITVTGTSGYSQAFGDLVYLDPTDSRWEAADANSAGGADGDARGMLGMVVSTGTDGNACTILLTGIIRADAKFPSFTVNNPIYVSETAGSVTQTAPTTTDAVIRIVGAALTADEMFFRPDFTYTTHV